MNRIKREEGAEESKLILQKENYTVIIQLIINTNEIVNNISIISIDVFFKY